MALTWSMFDRVVEGPAEMLVAQAALYAYGCAAPRCARAFPTLSARVPRWLVAVIFSHFPPAMMLAGTIWKDIWTSAPCSSTAPGASPACCSYATDQQWMYRSHIMNAQYALPDTPTAALPPAQPLSTAAQAPAHG